MDEVKQTRKIKTNQSSRAQGFLTLLVLFALIPLYGLYFLPAPKPAQVLPQFSEWRSAAMELKRVGQYEEAARILEKVYENSITSKSRLEILHVLKEIHTRGRDWKSLLTVLYKIQSLDPSETGGSYKKDIYETLQRLGKDKDASLYLKARTSLHSTKAPTQGSDVVIASIEGEEIYTRDLGERGGGNAAERLKLLTQLVINRILKKESMGLMEDQDFLAEADRVLEEMRIAKFLDRKLSVQKISEFDLKNFYHSHLYLWNYPNGVQVSHIQLKSQEEVGEFQSNAPSSLESFESYAKQHSASLDKVRSGRVERYVESDSLPSIGTFPGLFDFLWKQKKGLCGPFPSRRGQHFFWVRSRRSALKSTFEEKKREVEKAYRKEFEDQFKEKYFRELLKAYDVKVFTDRL